MNAELESKLAARPARMVRDMGYEYVLTYPVQHESGTWFVAYRDRAEAVRANRARCCPPP